LPAAADAQIHDCRAQGIGHADDYLREGVEGGGFFRARAGVRLLDGVGVAGDEVVPESGHGESFLQCAVAELYALAVKSATSAAQSATIGTVAYIAAARLDTTGSIGHIADAPANGRNARSYENWRAGMTGRILVGVMILATAPFLTGCSTMSNTGKGALAGGAIGAGSGAIISEATGGKAGPGAVIGGIAGALIGGAMGNEEDRREREALQARADQASAAASQMGIADVIHWTKEGRSDDLIINQIRTTNSTYQLSPEDVRMLSSNGVSDRVIMEMQNRRPHAYPPGRWVRVPPPGPVIYGPPPPVYIVHPPPPPPSFGIHVSN
jgi:surface antigen